MTNVLELTYQDLFAMHDGAPIAHALSNGRFTTVITAAGGGFARLGALALTRWTPDRTCDADGAFVYVRDLDAGRSWSAGAQPAGHGVERYVARFAAGRAELVRHDGGVETRVELCVAPDADVELRRITLTNASDRARRLDVTTYAEAVLNTPDGDAAHPAFSKLFVQTERAGAALYARRRQRSPDDAPLCVGHTLWRDGAPAADPVEVETDRARFIGRGRTLARPRALDAGVALSGAVGNVLDPVLAMRRTLTLGAGERAVLVAALAASEDRAGVDAILARFVDARAVDAAFDGAAERARALAGAGDRVLHAALGAVAYAHPRAGTVRAWRDALDDAAWFEAARALGTAGPPPAVEPGRRGGRRAGPTDRHADAGRGPRLACEEPLLFFNGHGGFSEDGTEYVIRMSPGDDGRPARPPLPWANVVANERVGFIATESGACHTWGANSREQRLTPWRNDPVTDPHAEALYLRDEDTRACWSPTPGPMPGPGAYEARHGFGYTCWRHAAHGLETEVVAFVPRHDPVRIVRLRVTNHGDQPRRLTVWSYAQLVLGGLPWETGPTVESRADAGAILATNAAGAEFASLVAFAAASRPSTHTADRGEFLGTLGSAESPAALAGDGLSGRTGTGLDPCAAFAVPLDVAPRATEECVFLLGEGRDADEARRVIARYREGAAVAAALDATRAFWRELLGAVRIETPAPALDLMVNGWLSYQNLSCRVWGRTAYYQSGGAFGFRDQLQDCAALVHLAPALTRRQIVLHAAHQLVEGDVLHWWHPPSSKGIRTRFADDLLWLPLVAAYYVETTGDATVLDETARYLTAPALDAGEDEIFVLPEESGERGDVYEHCCRAIDRASASVGMHGLPLMGTGDWNDGMNRVGREGRGESVWMGFFLAHVLDAFAPLCDGRGDGVRASRYRAHLARLIEALNAEGAGWDGAWYRRAYYDDGTPLGAATNDECRIDTIAQAWAVISRAAPTHRALDALDAMERHLVSEGEGIIRLLTPAFDRTPNDPGYIKGYLPGVRENGGQYTHGALWAVRALAEVGREERAARLLEMLSPVSRARTPAEVEVYRTEPYVVAADVYGVAPHVGRGGWTWYTGSAGWMFRVALESVLGVTLHGGDTLVLRPCVPREWPGFTVRYRLPDGATTYEIVVTRAAGSTVVRAPAAVHDGAVRIPVVRDGQVHRVDVALGDDVGPRYAPLAALGGGAYRSTAPGPRGSHGES